MEANQSMRNNTSSFDRVMNAVAAMTGQRNANQERSNSLPLTETDVINVDKFKVS